MASTYLMQLLTLGLACLCLWNAMNAWHVKSEGLMLWNCLLAFINGCLFTFQFIIRARLRRIP